MRVIVCGSRRWHDRQRIADRMYDLPPGSTIVHGAAQGADRIAEQEAQKCGHLIEAHPADWGSLGKRAGLVRNSVMANLGADLCIAFWDGRSTGTAHMMEEARKRAIPVETILKEQA